MSFNRFHVLIFSAFMIVLSMVGLYFKVEYSGWILLLGLVGGAMNIEKDDDCDCEDNDCAEEYGLIWLEGFHDRAAGMIEDDNPYAHTL